MSNPDTRPEQALEAATAAQEGPVGELHAALTTLLASAAEYFGESGAAFAAVEETVNDRWMARCPTRERRKAR